jgi:transposase-like protein
MAMVQCPACNGTKHAAVKLMRNLLKKYGFVPDRLITDDLRSYGAAARASASA